MPCIYVQVAGLAIVSVICFTSSAAVAMATNIPVSFHYSSYTFSPIQISAEKSNQANLFLLQLVYHWHEQQIGDIYTSLLLVLYYFIGTVSNFPIPLQSCISNMETARFESPVGFS